jgi:hypothetical protein
MRGLIEPQLAFRGEISRELQDSSASGVIIVRVVQLRRRDEKIPLRKRLERGCHGVSGLE